MGIETDVTENLWNFFIIIPQNKYTWLGWIELDRILEYLESVQWAESNIDLDIFAQDDFYSILWDTWTLYDWYHFISIKTINENFAMFSSSSNH